MRQRKYIYLKSLLVSLFDTGGQIKTYAREIWKAIHRNLQVNDARLTRFVDSETVGVLDEIGAISECQALAALSGQ